jgi:hypothetical protein
MFKKKRTKIEEKQLEFNLKLIEKIGTLETQNRMLHNKIKQLEQRVDSLEASGRVGF